MIEQFKGGPVGLEAIAAATGEDAKTIEEVYEPYLLQIGFINRTTRGRVVTEKAYHHLKINLGLPLDKLLEKGYTIQHKG
jgi:Holliday junction DNA helicase RuvB